MGLITLACLHWSFASFVNQNRCTGIFECKTEYSEQQAVDYVNKLPKDQRQLVQFKEGETYTVVYYCDQLEKRAKQ